MVALNVRGFGKLSKQTAILLHIKKFNPTFICLSDTRFDQQKERIFRNCFGSDYQLFFANLSSNARGTMILIPKEIPCNVLNSFSSNDGNRISIVAKLYGKTMTISSIYGPNDDNPNFFKDLFNDVYNCNCEYNVLTGDFNTAPDKKDYFNYATLPHPNARIALLEALTNYNCSDAYRYMHGNKSAFTWRAEGGRPQKSRLDLCIVSNNLIPYLANSTIKNKFMSDHDLIINSFDFQKIVPGRGFWRFDNTLLKSENFVSTMKNKIVLCLAKYVSVENYTNFLEQAPPDEIDIFLGQSPEMLHGYNYNINPNIMLEMLVNDCRNEAIGFMVSKRKAENQRKNVVSKRLELLRAAQHARLLTDTEEAELNDLSEEYEQILEHQAHKIMQRDKILSKLDGEKPSKFFCSLEKDRSTEKFIPRLNVKRGGMTVTITDQGQIEGEIEAFYKNLYSNKDSELSGDTIESFLGVENMSDLRGFKKLSFTDSNSLEGEITTTEMKTILNNSKGDSAPGQTGLTFEFYKKFWDLLGHFLVNAANYSKSIGKLPDCLSRGTISLLPKGDKDREQLGNWRPLTLLSVEYKLISGCIAKRMSKVMPKIINPDQVGFVSNRYIGEGIRLVYDVMDYAKKKNFTGMLLLVDFTKAFDSVSHSFIINCLDTFGFSTDFIDWIKLFIYNFFANTIHAGNISNRFLLGRGTKQGDPISSLLFILCVEILALKIDKEMEGLKVGNCRVKKTMYADDLTLFLEYSEADLRKAIEILKKFYKLSGLQINLSKTQVVVFGNIPNQDLILCSDLNLTWHPEFKLLGIFFDSKLENMYTNYEKAMDKIKSVMNNWRHRMLTPYGRSVLAKTLLLSKLAHIHLVLPDLTNKKIKEIEDAIYDFIWKGKHQVSKNVCKIGELYGGLNMPDIKLSINSLKIGWVRRGYRNEGSTWVRVLDAILATHNQNLNLVKTVTALSLNDIGKIRTCNPFWNNCFQKLVTPSCALLKRSMGLHTDLIIWGSALIHGTERMVSRHYYNNIADNIVTIADTLCLADGKLVFRPDNELSKPNQIDHAKLAGFRMIISRYLLEVGIVIGNYYNHSLIAQPRIPLIVTLISMSNKGCSVWTKLLKNTMNMGGVREMEQKQEQRLGIVLGVNYWDSCYVFTKKINFNNRIKWMQYQITRGVLQVNRVVSIYKDNVNPECTFCNTNVETIRHLFFDCDITKTFLQQCINRICDLGHHIDFNDLRFYEFLFIQRKRLRCFKTFFFFLHIKYFIWINRCRNTLPTLEVFMSYLKKELALLAECTNVYTDLQFIHNFINNL